MSNFKIKRDQLNELIRVEAKKVLSEVISEREVYNSIDKIANKIEENSENDEEINPYEEILIKLVQYIDDENVEEGLEAVADIYDVEINQGQD